MQSLHRVALAALASFASLAAAACDGSVQDESTSSHTAGAAGDAGGTAGTGGAGATGGAAGTGGSPTTGSGTGGTGTPPPDIGMPSDMYPASHPSPPKVQDYGGPVLAAPKVQPIFFANDTPGMTGPLTDFVNKVGATQYWAAVASEYGVGPLAAQPAVMLSESITGTITDGDIQAWLSGKLNADDPAFAPPDENIIYAIFYPAGVKITEQGATSCSDFGGYHSNVQLDANHQSMEVAYAVMPRCSNFAGLFGVDAITATASHELIEGVTDPYPMTSPAYALTDTAHVYWVRALGGGEVGDMCTQDPEAFTKFDELPYAVQRSWSNKAAAAGHDPCVPQPPGDVYFNAVPVMNDTVVYGGGGFQANVKGVKIAELESKTIDVALFSDGPSDLIHVKALDYASIVGGQPRLSFSFDADQGLNGQRLHLTITVDSASNSKSELFFLVSEVNGQQNLWVGVVGQ